MTLLPNPQPEPVDPDLVDAIEDLFALDVDYDALALWVMDKAPDAEIAFTALLAFAPHLGIPLDLGQDPA